MHLIRNLLTIMLVLTLVACGGGSNNTETSISQINTDSGAIFNEGTDIPLKIVTITENGSTVTVDGTGTNIDGVRVKFPEGAVNAPTDITIGYNDGNVTLPAGVTSNRDAVLLSIHTNGESNFNQLVEIEIPFDDIDSIPSPFYIDGNNKLRAVTVTKIDEENKILTFVTSHTSTWAWFSQVNTSNNFIDTGFRPNIDGFRVINDGSSVNNFGECFGMSIFSQWYFMSRRNVLDGKLYNTYLETVGRDVSGNSLTGQDVIATRVHSAANQEFNFTKFIAPQIDLTHEIRFKKIYDAMAITRNPINIYLLDHDENEEWGHDVMAYSANKDTGEIYIYDPNYPGAENIIHFDKNNNSFNSYKGYRNIGFNGSGTYSIDESFENILEDAKHSFTGNNQPHISILSHENGESVTERNIELKGSIESSEILITKLDVYIGNNKFETDVSDDGSFSLGISLDSGKNDFRFLAKGLLDREVEVTPNNLDISPFSLILDQNLSVMHVTLTWDRPNTDVDLYVIDPTNDVSFWPVQHQITNDGGELDRDDVDGYGPEHWTLSSDDVIRWGETYYIRVHYYLGDVGTNYKLSIKLYEGTDREAEYIKAGYLGVSNYENYAPNAIGQDWSDTYIVTLTQPSTRQKNPIELMTNEDKSIFNFTDEYFNLIKSNVDL